LLPINCHLILLDQPNISGSLFRHPKPITKFENTVSTLSKIWNKQISDVKEQPKSDLESLNGLYALLFSFSIASLTLLPHWLQRFSMSGVPSEDRFLPNHYFLSSVWQLSDGAGLILTLMIAVGIFFGRQMLILLLGPAYPYLTSVLSAIFALYVFSYSRFLIYLGLGRVSSFDRDSLPSVLSVFDWVMIAAITALALSLLMKRSEFGDFSRLVLIKAAPIGFGLGLVAAYNGVLGYTQFGLPLSVQMTPQAKFLEARSQTGFRVVWLIFDQLDRIKAFDNRDPSVDMPNFDKLISRSVFFAKSVGPVQGGTQQAVASLVTGQLMDVESAPGTLKTRAASAESYLPLEAYPNIFARAQSEGFSVSITSHLLPNNEPANPYCQMFREAVTKCWNEGRWLISDTDLLDGIAFVVGRLWHFVRLDPWRATTHHEQEVLDGVDRYEAMVSATGEVVKDPKIDFAYAHILVPHWPYIYDRKTNDFAYNRPGYPSDHEGYLDGLELADRALGRILDEISISPAYDRTALIVTADHGDGNDQVPLIVSLPNTVAPMTFERRAPTLNLSVLVMELLNGKARKKLDVINIIHDGEVTH
jgi:hypothetical protein